MKIKSVLFSLILAFTSFNVVNVSVAQNSSSNMETKQTTTNTTPLDFTNLTQSLQAQNWRRANDETRDLILQATGRKAIGWIPPSDLQSISCSDLQTIDNLWKEYSNGRFGFSVQFPLYLETGNRPGRLVSDDAFNRFGDKVGWRKNGDWIIFIENLNYSINAPIGHFPNPRPEYSITGGRLLYSTLAQRMVQCNLVK